MTNAARNRASLLCAMILTGCAATLPKIDPAKTGQPKSVVIVDFPKTRPLALIGAWVPAAQAYPGTHFSATVAPFFELSQAADPKAAEVGPAMQQQLLQNIVTSPRPLSVGGGAAAGAITGLIAAVIDAKAAETQERAAAFPREIADQLPAYDLHRDFMTQLTTTLRQAGLQVSVIDADGPPTRLHWPAKSVEGKDYPSAPIDQHSPVDADVLVQVSPLAFYSAPGLMSAYHRNVTIGIALFNGRTKEFLGRQTVQFAPDSQFEYSTYDNLSASAAMAATALRFALLGLVPQTASLISGRTVTGAPLAADPVTLPAQLSGSGRIGAAPSGAVESVFPDTRRQSGYVEFLKMERPRAFAISDNGHYGRASGFTHGGSEPSDPKNRALRRCSDAAGKPCVLYAVDDTVVLQGGLPDEAGRSHEVSASPER